MITFPHIGYIGRLGNQMFQYSALVNIAKKNKLDYYINSPKIELLECFDLPVKINSYYNPNVSSPNKFSMCTIKDPCSIEVSIGEYSNLFSTNFDKKFYDINHDNKSLIGFFQNFNYFKEYENTLRSHFVFKKNIYQICKNYFTQRFFNTKTLSLHIRRTDYLESSVLNSLPLDYYENALKHFDSSLPVLVFSDDTDWCESQSMFSDERFIIMRSNNTYIDLCLMSLCDYHIIANSSFSWWGSWLSKSKKTICPKQWFSSNYSHLDSDGLRLNKWISI
jgi:hypothetical protein